MREAMPTDAPKALEKGLFIGKFVDTDFSGNKVSSISSIGLIVFLTVHQFIGSQRSSQHVIQVILEVSALI